MSDPRAPFVADVADSDSETTDDAFLDGALSILQPRTGFRAGVDAVLLAAAVPQTIAAGIRVLDAGAGVGVAGLCLAHRLPEAHLTLVERAPELAELARCNVARNGLGRRVDVVETDLLAPPDHLDGLGLVAGRFGLLLANPPWLTDGHGRASTDPVKARANAMPDGQLDGWLRFLVRIAAPDGLLIMLHRADALDRVLAGLRGRFGGAEILPVHPRPERPANRILLRARKGSRAPLAILPSLSLHDERGYTPTVEAVLRRGAALPWPDRDHAG